MHCHPVLFFKCLDYLGFVCVCVNSLPPAPECDTRAAALLSSQCLALSKMLSNYLLK